MLTDEDMKKLRKIFYRLLDFNSNEANILNICQGMNMSNFHFSTKVFSIFRYDKSETINFPQFIFSIWIFCSISKIEMIEYVFILYSMDGGLESFEDGLNYLIHHLHRHYFFVNQKSKK
jgi:hypothetical protein